MKIVFIIKRIIKILDFIFYEIYKLIFRILMNIIEIKNKIEKLKDEKEKIKKYLNFGSDIQIIEIQEALTHYDERIQKFEKKLENITKN
tara:strand:- start:2201 stop:2467 length:267 start_codon:yes stop_codon:yes gene_type:complete